jgi:hypothetical protein
VAIRRALTTSTNVKQESSACVPRCRLDDSCLIVCESTGGHEAALLAAALANGRGADRADAPARSRPSIRFFGTAAKTDAFDARALVLARRDLIDQRIAFNNRIAAPGAEPAAFALRRLCEQIHNIE